jgi:hypothetical protein
MKRQSASQRLCEDYTTLLLNSIDKKYNPCYYVCMSNPFITYNAQEFLPIYHEGILANKSEFIAYKAKKAAVALLNAADKAYHAAGGVDSLK